MNVCNPELVSDKHGLAYDWRCTGCGQVKSYFDQRCINYECIQAEYKGTWCPIGCLMIAEEVTL